MNVGKPWSGSCLNIDKQFPSGMLFKFINAPPRWSDDGPREPAGLLGKVGAILDGPFPEQHSWGGLFWVLVEGRRFQYYGDFMEEME